VDIELWFKYGRMNLPELSRMEFIPADDGGVEYTVYRRNFEFEQRVYRSLAKRFKNYFQPDYYSRIFKIPGDQTAFLLTYGKAILDEGIEIRIKEIESRLQCPVARRNNNAHP
jgi:hypothetical protein